MTGAVAVAHLRKARGRLRNVTDGGDLLLITIFMTIASQGSPLVPYDIDE